MMPPLAALVQHLRLEIVGRALIFCLRDGPKQQAQQHNTTRHSFGFIHVNSRHPGTPRLRSFVQATLLAHVASRSPRRCITSVLPFMFSAFCFSLPHRKIRNNL